MRPHPLLVMASVLCLVPSSPGQDVGFVPNEGQWPAEVRYCRPGAGWAVRVLDDGLDAFGGAGRLSIRWGDDSGQVAIEPLGEQKCRVHQLIGQPSDWHTNLPAFAALRVHSVMPGVDLLIDSDPSRALVFETGQQAIPPITGVLRAWDPSGWRQDPLLPRVEVRASDATRSAHWVLEPDGSFVIDVDAVTEDDEDDEAAADPWMTLYGASNGEDIRDIAIGHDGSVFVGLTTYSPDFPTTPGAFDPVFISHGNAQEGALLAYTAEGVLEFATFLGGTDGTEVIYHLDPHPLGGVVLAGIASSLDFPVSEGAFDSHIEPFFPESFIAWLDASGEFLHWATFTNTINLAGIVVHENGEVTFGYHTNDPAFPTTSGAYKEELEGFDGFVARLSADGTSLVYATLLGGAGNDSINLALDADEEGRVAVMGFTSSSDFPISPESFMPETDDTSSPVYVALLTDYGQNLAWATYFDGAGWSTSSERIAIGPLGRVILTGHASSDGFPLTPGAIDTQYGLGASFLTCFDATGSSLVYSTFLGGSRVDDVFDMHVDRSGVVTLAGGTTSTDFPVTPGSLDTVKQLIDYDVFVERFDPSGRSILYATWLGGSAHDGNTGAFLDVTDEGRIVVAANANSSDIPVTDGTTHVSSSDAYVASFEPLPLVVDRLGHPTPGCLGNPIVGVRGLPQLGEQGFGFTCSQTPPGSTRGWLLLGTSALAASQPLSGAALWIDPATPVAAVRVESDPLGWCDVRLPLPDDPGLEGLGLAGQFLWLDACAPGGLSASSALVMSIEG